MTAQLLSTRHIYLLLSMSYEYFTTIPQQYGGTPHYSSSGSPLQTGDPLEPTSHKTFIFYKSVQPTSIHESKDNVQEFGVFVAEFTNGHLFFVRYDFSQLLCDFDANKFLKFIYSEKATKFCKILWTSQNI